jgi:hypothetical protein
MPEHPAELPEGSGAGSGGRIDWSRIRGGIGGPNELPPPDWVRGSLSQLVNEVFRLRDRVHSLESSMLAGRMRVGNAAFGGVIGSPPEMPVPEGEGGGGGWGGRVPIPPEIQEINEMPISRFAAEFSALVTRFAKFESQVSQQLATISQRLDTLKK